MGPGASRRAASYLSSAGVTAADAFDWAERARAMIQGVYRDLVLGPIEARCFTQPF